ncbi:10767_t:CDS:2 [Acaulospora colombiana]|uniref:10767_t:CDS:1 n=1 Tax=Acaulospora colombiana TaxID=27376 RepID=A0ACA9K224_9GLOM|nr:10767_t:CDS:2 [Acaulospora colombiana]
MPTQRLDDVKVEEKYVHAAKEDSSGYLTTPTPDHLPKSFYQTPVILERRPQSTVMTTTQIASKPAEASSKQVTSQIAPKINHDNSINAVSSVSVSRVEVKQTTIQGAMRGKPSDRPFIKMINERGIFNQESVLKILSELPGHFVIGVCGPQGSGKSTVVSAFCQDPQNAFSIQSVDALNFASHETMGIDIHVTSERIIILDTQPLFSLSVLEHAIRNDYISDNMSPELWLESQSLQVIVFLYSVCNVVITVTESADYSMWNFLKKAEMMKYRIPEFPTVPSLMSADTGAEYYPDIGR